MPKTTLTVQVTGMHCGSCALLIDDALGDLPGVNSSQTSAKHGRSTIELDPEVSSPAEVLGAIDELGYNASLGA